MSEDSQHGETSSRTECEINCPVDDGGPHGLRNKYITVRVICEDRRRMSGDYENILDLLMSESPLTAAWLIGLTCTSRWQNVELERRRTHGEGNREQ